MEKLNQNQILEELEFLRKRLEKIETFLAPVQKEFFVIEDLEKILGLTRQTIYLKISRGELPKGVKKGKRLYFSREDVFKYLKNL